MTSLVSFNQLDDPNKVKVGMRLYLKAPRPPSRPPQPQPRFKQHQKAARHPAQVPVKPWCQDQPPKTC